MTLSREFIWDLFRDTQNYILTYLHLSQESLSNKQSKPVAFYFFKGYNSDKFLYKRSVVVTLCLKENIKKKK